MIKKLSDRRWPATVILFLCMAAFSLLNIQRMWISNKLVQLKTDESVHSFFKNVSLEKNPFEKRGLYFSKNETWSVNLPDIGHLPRFTIEFPVVIDHLDVIHFRLTGSPQSIDFGLLEPKFQKFKAGTHFDLRIERRPDRIEFIADGKILESVKYQGQVFERFEIEDIKSSFALKKVSISSEEQKDISVYTYSFLDGKSLYFSVLVIIAAAILILITFLINRTFIISGYSRTVWYVFICFSPMFTGTLFPIPIQMDRFIPQLLLVCSVAFILGIFFTNSKKYINIISELALVSPCTALFFITTFSAAIESGIFIAVFYFVIIHLTAGSIKNRSFDEEFWRFGFTYIPAIFGYFLIFRNVEDHIPFMSAMVFCSMMMLMFYLFYRRHDLKWYTVIILLTSVLPLYSAELVARNSNMEPYLQPMDIGKGFKVDNALFYVPGEFFDNGAGVDIVLPKFRSGKTGEKPAPGTFRIMTVGGSTTYGDGIDSNDFTYSGRLEKCLNEKNVTTKTEVINAGVKGYNLFQLLQIFKTYGIKYHPHLIILYINTPDAGIVFGPYTYHELWKMKNDGSELDKLLEKETEKDPALQIARAQSFLQESALYNLLVKAVTEKRQKELKPFAQRFGVIKDVNPLEDYRANLNAFIRLCKENGIRLALVDEFAAGYVYDEGTKATKVRLIMKEVSKELDINYFELNAVLQKLPDKSELVFPHDDSHLSVKGHEIISRYLCDYILTNHYIEGSLSVD